MDLPVYTVLGVPSFVRFCYDFLCELRGPAWAVGSYSSGPPAGGTFQNTLNKISRMKGHLMPNSVKSWPKKFVLSCVNSPGGFTQPKTNFFAHLCTVKFVECDTHQSDITALHAFLKTENPSAKLRRLQYMLLMMLASLRNFLFFLKWRCQSNLQSNLSFSLLEGGC